MDKYGWTKYEFDYENVNDVLKVLFALRKTGLQKLLDHDYTVALDTELISSADLESKLVNEWFDYILNNGEKIDSKLYPVAKTLMDNDEFNSTLSDSLIKDIKKRTHVVDSDDLCEMLDSFFYSDLYVACDFLEQYESGNYSKNDPRIRLVKKYGIESLKKYLTEENKAYTYAVDPSKVSGNWLNRVKFLLKLDLKKEEEALRQALGLYIESSAAAGFVGIVGAMNDFGYEVIPDVQNLENKMDLAKIFNLLKMEYTDILEKGEIKPNPFTLLKSISEQREYIKKLTNRIISENVDEYGLGELLEKVGKKEYQKATAYNSNLGFEELELIFLKHETLRYFEKESSLADQKLEFRDVDEITEFLVDYFETMTKGTAEGKKIKKNFVNRLQLLRSSTEESNAVLNDILGRIITTNQIEVLDEITAEGNSVFQNDINWLSDKSNKWILKGSLFQSYDYEMRMKAWNDISSPLKNYYKMTVASIMAERNIRDLLQFLDGFDGTKGFDYIDDLIADAARFSSYTNSLLLLPVKTKYKPSLHEAYVNAMRRNIFQTRFKKYYNTWISLMENYVSEKEGTVYLDTEIIKCDDYVRFRKDYSAKELGEKLKGSRDTAIGVKIPIIKNTAEWLNSFGIFNFDVEKFSDFKVLYDLLYRFKIAPVLQEEKSDVKSTRLKGKNANVNNLTKDEQTYLILGAFISKLYNRSDVTEESFIKLCLHIRDSIALHFQLFEIVNSDYILTFVNAFRTVGANYVEEECKRY